MMTTMSTKSSGIVHLLNRSMPFFTPPRMMTAHIARNTVWQTRGAREEEMKPSKAVPSSCCVTPRKPMERDRSKYSTLQPPTTL